MPYLVLARKWRPQTFDEVVSQEHVTQTLKNAVLSGRIAHAYLFSGPRGVGKTTCARILAKSLNCIKGATVDPCGECASCREIINGNSIDVIEIDGASNRGIDEIRLLRENVKYSPARGKYKIYVIDEVHMLTEPAFNALLKTLEEPPPHIIFILATTEPKKIPLTILSRCQRFNFRSIPSKDIKKCIKDIIDKEKFDYEEEAIISIARRAEGSIRDALSLVDTVLSYSTDKAIRQGDLNDILGISSMGTISQIRNALIQRRSNDALNIIEHVSRDGQDLILFLKEIIEDLRNLAIVKISSTPSEVADISDESLKELKAISGQMDTEDILSILRMLCNTEVEMKRSSHPRIDLEASVINICLRPQIESLDNILRKLKKLEKGAHEPLEQKPEKMATRSSKTPEKKQEDVVLKEDSTTNVLSETSHEIDEGWGKTISLIKEKKTSLGSLLEQAKLQGVEGGRLLLGFENGNSFIKDQLEDNNHRQIILSTVRKHFNEKVDSLEIRFLPSTQEPAKIANNVKDEKAQIKDVLEIFGGEIIE